MQKKLNWLKINYGQGLIFSQNLLHGNVINKEKLADGVLIVDLNHYSHLMIQKNMENILHQLILGKPILGMNYMTQKSNKNWYMGYIFSREIDGNIIPQKVQNLVIRDFAQRSNMNLILSSTEYKMQNSFLILNSLIAKTNKYGYNYL